MLRTTLSYSWTLKGSLGREHQKYMMVALSRLFPDILLIILFFSAKIFAVATLLSSKLLFNSVKTIDQQSLDYLEYQTLENDDLFFEN